MRSSEETFRFPQSAIRNSAFLTHPVFNTHHTETEMLRYLRRLESRDLSLTTSMIPLGSCTMKLNATAEMFPISWPEFAKLHPFSPDEQTVGYREMCDQLGDWLAEITGFAAVSLQPNAGSQGEYAGLLAIREYHASRGEAHRKVCLIPTSAHGTNPASAVMAGFKVVPVACLKDGDIDLADLRAKADTHKTDLAALDGHLPVHAWRFRNDHPRDLRNRSRARRPGLHGWREHERAGRPLPPGRHWRGCLPSEFAQDLLHSARRRRARGRTDRRRRASRRVSAGSFRNPTIRHPTIQNGVGPVAAAPYGSASILTISWMYIRMMGGEGLTEATKIAILNANYIAKRLDRYFPVLFKGKRGLVAHECILDLRQWKSAGVEVEDVAKRLMDYGFHAPTVSFPVAGTMMVEPTESESKEEIDRFCDAMISIHGEIEAVASGKADRQNNVLKNAPHTAQQVISDKWDRPYSREQAAYPAPWTREYKFWPAVSRIDSVYGDRNLICSCPPMEAFAE